MPPMPSAADSVAFPTFRVLGTRFHAVQIADVVAQMERWITARSPGHFISVANAHSVTEAHRQPGFKRVLKQSDLCVPDGMPLVWVGRLRGHPLRRRVSGPDLLLEFCRSTAARGYRHYFYGGQPGVPERMADVLQRQFPELQTAGTYSPPFRLLTPEEDAEVVQKINESAADVLWVGLGCPKQERWMYEHKDRLAVPVMVGVGYAFDLHTGKLQRAPRWMQEHGLEWFFRIVQDPKRLGRRALLYYPSFVVLVTLELLGLRQFD